MKTSFIKILFLTLFSFSSISFSTVISNAQFTDYIGVRVLNNNHLMDRSEGDRLLYTFNNFLQRSAKKRACDPRSVAKRPYPMPGVTPPGCQKTMQPAPTNTQFDTKWDAFAHRYQFGFLRGAQRTIRSVRLGLFRKEPGGWTERQGYTCEWTIDGEVIASDQPCRKWVTKLATGKHKASVTVFQNDEQVYQTNDISFEIRDVLIVAMGESFGSGEGNPHTHIVFKKDQETGRFYRPAPAWWLDPRCHRSLFSSSSLATMLLADENRGTSFSILNTACSGAETTYGLTKKYSGRLTAKQAHHLWPLTTGNARPSDENFRDEGFKGYCLLYTSPSPRD